MRWRSKLAVLVFVTLGVAGSRLFAQVNTSPGVARVSLIHGEVSTARGDTGTWVAAAINEPLVTGDSISTGASSRAEVQLDYANVLRLGEKTEAKVADLSNSHIQVQLAQGLADYTVLKGNQADLEIDTPNMAVHPAEPGTYRIEVFSNSEATVIVRKGSAQISTPQGSTTVKQSEMIRVEGTQNPQYRVVGAPARDAWDQWNEQRNNIVQDAKSYQYTNRYYTGAEDLDAYGHWVNVPGYNWCWTPYVDAGWIPYRNGRWAWEPYYGWTWVSAESWGWAPYHYGRWFNYGGSWCWWPGPVTPAYYPVWAPAYVSFFGFSGGRFGFGVGFGFGGFGSIGWLPIGPCDPFFPWYGYGRGFGYGRRFGYNSVNITNIRNITNITNIRNVTRNGSMPYVAPLAGRGRPVYSNLQAAISNSRVRRAIVTVPARDFAAGRVPQVRTAALTQSALEHAQLVSGHVPVIPTRASLNPSGRAAARAALPSAAVNGRHFFTVHQPPAARQNFTRQVAGIRQQLTRPSSFTNRATINTRRTNEAATRPMQSTGAVRSANQSFRGEPAQVSRPSSQNARTGWRSFGAPAASTSTRSSNSTRQPTASQSFTSRRDANAGTPRPGWHGFSNSGSQTHPVNRQNPQAPARDFKHASPTSEGGGGWQGFSRSSRPQASAFGSSRPFSNRSGSEDSFYSRPALNLQRPIVTSRSSQYGGYRGSWDRGYTRSSGPSRGRGSRSYRAAGGFHGAARSAPAHAARR
ncbi:MAG: DUF6600 domain-containing protein [Terriglobia bacterium]